MIPTSVAREVRGSLPIVSKSRATKRIFRASESYMCLSLVQKSAQNRLLNFNTIISDSYTSGNNTLRGAIEEVCLSSFEVSSARRFRGDFARWSVLAEFYLRMSLVLENPTKLSRSLVR